MMVERPQPHREDYDSYIHDMLTQLADMANRNGHSRLERSIREAVRDAAAIGEYRPSSPKSPN